MTRGLPSWAVCVTLLLSIHSPPAQASDPPGARVRAPARGGGIALSLRDAILMAFRNHADIRVARLEEAVRGADIAMARSPFDPLFTGGVDYRRSEIPLDDQPFNGNELGEIRNETLGFRSEVSQRYYTGTRAAIALTTSLDRGETFIGGIAFNDRTELRPRLGFTVTQPLLKGFSIKANTSDIRLARNAYSMSIMDFRILVDGVLADVENRYWEAVFAKENLGVREKALETARAVLGTSEARFRVGTVPKLEVITAQADVASQEEGIIRARNDLENARDRLAQVVLEQETGGVGLRAISPTDEPALEEIDPALEESISIAMQRRPDLRKSRKELEQLGIQRRKAKHELLPSLNFTGTIGSSGLGLDTGNAFKEMFSGDFLDWGVGLSLEVPLGGNRFAEGNLARFRNQERQLRIRLRNREVTIHYEVREGVRGVHSARERVRAAGAARILSEEVLEVEQAKLNEGATIANAVLEAQEDLLTAQSRELRARIDYRIALSLLQKAESTLLDRHGIKIEEEESEE